MAVTLEFFADPTAFLSVASEHLGRSPSESTGVAATADRAAGEIADGIEQPADDWYVVIRTDGQIVGVAMRTAPFEPRPLYLLTMPKEAALSLAGTLFRRGEEVRAVNGALPAAQVFADETARLAGRTARVHMHARLF